MKELLIRALKIVSNPQKSINLACVSSVLSFVVPPRLFSPCCYLYVICLAIFFVTKGNTYR